MAFASQSLGAVLELRGIFGEAISQNLKAVEYSQKTDNKAYQHVSYASLSRLYARLGDLEHAEEYFNKIPPDILSHRWQSFGATLSKAVLLAAKDQWKESNQQFEKAFKQLELLGHPMEWELQARTHSAWALNKQGRVLEEKVQLEEIQKIHEKIEKRFGHVDIEATLMAPRKVFAGDKFGVRLDLVNVSRKPSLIAKVESLMPPGLVVVSAPVNYRLENGTVELQERSIGPFQVETVKLELKASKPGAFTLNSEVTFIDEMNQTQTCKPNSITITAQPAQPKYEVLPGRVSTGLEVLDVLLLGGIPEKYAVVVTSSSTDEREQLIKRFLEAGATAGETTFHITAEAENAKALAQKYPSNFHLFVCNPQADAMVQSLPNVFKLKGVENLTEIDITLTKAFRTLNPSEKGPKRICIEILSDVLLQHHAINTRRWLNALLPTLKSKGFTILAVVDPQMHPAEEVQAILSLFDGEIRISEKETPEGTRQTLKIRKLYNQKYLDSEIVLTKEKLSA
jgi:KaiC/GvpD/RAD55 family RecA-like ATPase